MLSFPADDRRITYADTDPYAVHPDLSKPEVADRQFHIGRHLDGEAVADAGFHAKGYIGGGEKALLIIIVKRPAHLSSE